MDDLISRKQAIATADSTDYLGLAIEDVKKVTDEVVKGLKQLPSAHLPDMNVGDMISRQQAIEIIDHECYELRGIASRIIECIKGMPSAQIEEVIPHKNYKYLSDYWCECGWHLGKYGEVKYCAECGRKVKWDE